MTMVSWDTRVDVSPRVMSYDGSSEIPRRMYSVKSTLDTVDRAHHMSVVPFFLFVFLDEVNEIKLHQTQRVG